MADASDLRISPIVSSALFDEHRLAIVGEFIDLARVHNVSVDPTQLGTMADAVQALFADTGLDLRRLQRPGAAPLLIGRIDVDPALPTVGVYVHYDGQPVGEPDWRSDPFEPVLKRAVDGPVLTLTADHLTPDVRIYGRATADDRAPLMGLATVLRASRAASSTTAGRTPNLAVNLVVCFDGEEEIGSPHLGDYLAEAAHDLAADVWWICDGPVHQSGRPQVVCGVRGVVAVEMTVYGPRTDIHSGHYGNWAPNPAQTLVEILAACKSAGRIEIEGFDACATPITTADHQALAALPHNDAKVAARLGIAGPEREASLAESVLSSSFNIRGLAAGAVGAHARNVIPATATASIDMRLTDGVEPSVAFEQLVAHLRSLGVHVIDHEPTDAERARYPRLARVALGSASPGFRVSPDSPMVLSTAATIQAATGAAPIILPSLGGSMPLHQIRQQLGVDAIVVPIANPDNRQHAANENLALANLAYSVELFRALLIRNQ